MLQRRPDWQTEWEEMNEHGSPLPNEMVVMSSMGSGLTFCFVPVVDAEDGKTVVRMIMAQVTRGLTDALNDANENSSPRLAKPEIFDEEGSTKTVSHAVSSDWVP